MVNFTYFCKIIRIIILTLIKYVFLIRDYFTIVANLISNNLFVLKLN